PPRCLPGDQGFEAGMHERGLLGDPGDPPRTRKQHVVEDEGSTHMHMYVCVICWCQRLVKHRGAMDRHPPRLVSSPQALAFPSCRLRGLTPTGLWLVLGSEPAEDVAGTAPPAPSLAITPATTPHPPGTLPY